MYKRYKINDEIYRIRIFVLIGDNAAELAEKFELENDMFEAFTAVLQTGDLVMAFVQDESQITIDTIVHEAYHAMYYNFTPKSVELQSEGHEHAAYYIGWLVSKVYDIITKHNVRNKSNPERQ
jgi:hypothetical protein